MALLKKEKAKAWLEECARERPSLRRNLDGEDLVFLKPLTVYF